MALLSYRRQQMNNEIFDDHAEAVSFPFFGPKFFRSGLLCLVLLQYLCIRNSNRTEPASLASWPIVRWSGRRHLSTLLKIWVLNGHLRHRWLSQIFLRLIRYITGSLWILTGSLRVPYGNENARSAFRINAKKGAGFIDRCMGQAGWPVL